MSDTCSLFPPSGDPWPACLLPSHWVNNWWRWEQGRQGPGSRGHISKEEEISRNKTRTHAGHYEAHYKTKIPQDIRIQFKLATTSRWHSGKKLACQCRKNRDMGSILGLGRSPGGGNGNLLQYSCLGNPMDRAGWQSSTLQTKHLNRKLC